MSGISAPNKYRVVVDRKGNEWIECFVFCFDIAEKELTGQDIDNWFPYVQRIDDIVGYKKYEPTEEEKANDNFNKDLITIWTRHEGTSFTINIPFTEMRNLLGLKKIAA